jgi:hypothetical protein
VGDELRTNISDHVKEDDEDGDVSMEEMSSNLDQLEELCLEATKPVYDGLNVSTISTTIVLINMAIIHGVSNVYLDELVRYLSNILLPRRNRLPKPHYAAKRMVKKLGLNYDIIPCCPNGCLILERAGAPDCMSQARLWCFKVATRIRLHSRSCD